MKCQTRLVRVALPISDRRAGVFLPLRLHRYIFTFAELLVEASLEGGANEYVNNLVMTVVNIHASSSCS